MPEHEHTNHPAAAETAPETPAQRRKAAARAFQRRLPGWQQHLCTFCENWIFAFIVAMAIRHFFLEAYRIPTASMEPMLYGDPSILRGDTVVVDKFLFRFTGPERWGVTVFQYPWPEVDSPQGPVLAIDLEGRRQDAFPLRPNVGRNFVKRCLVVPGDTFFFANGDLFLADESGHFTAAVKPDDLQERLWLPSYQHGAQDGYLPWISADGATVRDDAGALVCDFAAGAGLRFTQPMIDLYLKPGQVDVLRMDDLRRVVGRIDPDRPLSRQAPAGQRGQRVRASMLRPVFTYEVAGGRNLQGSVWDLDRWAVQRLTSADLDREGYGKFLNDAMGEAVGDWRIHLRLAEVGRGPLVVTLALGGAQEVAWELAADGWRVVVDDQEVAAGEESLLDQDLQLIACDDRVRLRRGGADLFAPIAVAAIDPQVARPRLELRGVGEVRIHHLGLDRDVHYAAKGVLSDESDDLRQNLLHPQVVAATRRSFLAAMVDREASQRRLQALDGLGAGRRDEQWLAPIAVSPETAVTAPDGAYLMLGDNSPFSYDGRNWGFVPAENLRGTVLATLFPRLTLVR